jgi:hypothetical protein
MVRPEARYFRKSMNTTQHEAQYKPYLGFGPTMPVSQHDWPAMQVLARHGPGGLVGAATLASPPRHHPPNPNPRLHIKAPRPTAQRRAPQSQPCQAHQSPGLGHHHPDLRSTTPPPPRHTGSCYLRFVAPYSSITPAPDGGEFKVDSNADSDDLGSAVNGPDIAAATWASASTPVDVDDSPTASTAKTLRRVRATRFNVWQDMKQINNCVGGKEVRVAAICNYCKSCLSAPSTGGTGHLRRHVKACKKKTLATSLS